VFIPSILIILFFNENTSASTVSLFLITCSSVGTFL
jgi:hypothetical protein